MDRESWWHWFQIKSVLFITEYFLPMGFRALLVVQQTLNEPIKGWVIVRFLNNQNNVGGGKTPKCSMSSCSVYQNQLCIQNRRHENVERWMLNYIMTESKLVTPGNPRPVPKDIFAFSLCQIFWKLGWTNTKSLTIFVNWKLNWVYLILYLYLIATFTLS